MQPPMTRPTKDPNGLLNPSKRPMLCARLSVGNCLLESNQLYCSWCSQRKLNQVRLVSYIFKCTMVHVARAAPRLFTQWTHSSAAWNERFPKWAPEISICSSFQISNANCRIFDDMICESHMKTQNSLSMLILLTISAGETPVLLALQPLQAPFQQVVPPLHTPKLPFRVGS